MKKAFVIFFLLFFLTGALFADFQFKLYPGLYFGGNGPALDGIETDLLDMLSIGADAQVGMEFGRYASFYRDDFIFGIHANVGIDTGLPNRPNFYYGLVMDFYWGDDDVKWGISAGGGWNQTAASSKGDEESFYLRIGLPINFSGKFKSAFCFDWYPDTCYRLGIIMHYGIGF
jgi:hypothetical protein